MLSENLTANETQSFAWTRNGYDANSVMRDSEVTAGDSTEKWDWAAGTGFLSAETGTILNATHSAYSAQADSTTAAEMMETLLAAK